MCFVNIYIQYSLTKYGFGVLQREGGGGGGGRGGGGEEIVIWIIKGTLLFLIKIIWVYFFEEILIEVVMKKIIQIYFLNMKY